MNEPRSLDALCAVPGHRAFVGMGGNLGDVRACMQSALAAMLALDGTAVVGVSSLYRTKPVEAEGPDYLNAVAVLTSSLGPAELMRALLSIEAAHGRARSHDNAPRTLDLDLLWYGDAKREGEGLRLPHPRMLQRAFVLLPLAEVLDELPGDAETPLRGAMPGAAALDGLAEAQGIEKQGPLGSTPPSAP